MSHDQKPPRVRVVQNAGTPEQRRRHDSGSAAVAVIDGDVATDAAAPQASAPHRTAMVLLGAVFMVAAAAGGVLVALLHPA